jgi:flagellar motor component MotA
MKTEDFAKEYHKIVERAVFCSEKSRREGLLALDELIDENKCNQRDIMELGLRLVVDGTDAQVVDRILSNIVNLEEDNDQKKLKIVQKEAVLSIQAGDNIRILVLLLNSHVNIGIEDAMKIFNKT